MTNMADDVLVEKVFDYICGSGGFADLSALLRHPSPLGSENDGINWLKTQRDRPFVVISNGDMEGVRIQLKKKICKRYTDKGSCQQAQQGKCKFWHICKGFIEEHCDGRCGRSHDFFDGENREKTKQVGIDQHPNDTVRKIVGWSLPQVCQLYLRGECKSNKCFYLHVCSKAVQGSHCGCSMSHCFIDNHNKNILKQFDLVPHQSMSIEFVRCSVLLQKGPQPFGKVMKFSKADPGSAGEQASALATKSSAELIDPPRQDTVEALHAEISQPVDNGKLAQCVTPNDCSNTTRSSSKHARSISGSKMQAKSAKQDTATEPCLQPINNLGNTSTSRRSESNVLNELLNINAWEEENSSSSSCEKNKSENLDSKTTLNVDEANDDPHSRKMSLIGFQQGTHISGTGKAAGHSDSHYQKRKKKKKKSANSVKASQPKFKPATNQSSETGQKTKIVEVEKDPEDAWTERQRETSIQCHLKGIRSHPSSSKKAVFDCILRDYDGFVSIDTISKRQDLFPEGCGDVFAWFESWNDNFLLRQKESKIFEASVFISKARLCFNPTCSKKDCQYFHVCREFIADSCKFGAECPRNHSFQHDEDRNFISKQRLGGFTDAELRKLLQLSMPQVCMEYNDAICTSVKCWRIHICKSFVRKACQDQAHCARGLLHEDTFVQPDTATTLKSYGLKYTGDNVNFLLKMMLICEGTPGEKRGNCITPISLKAAPVENNEPSEMKVFESICKEYACSVSFSVICKRTDLFAHEFTGVEAWFRKKKGSFLITESDQGVILHVDAYSAKARLCLSYNSSHYGECKTKNCSYLHVCREYITDSCAGGATCPRNHHFQDGRERALLSKVKLHALTDEQLRKLVLSSTPRVCVEYNNGVCDRGDSCNRIHICSDHLKRSCLEGSECGLEHDSAMHTPHTEAILERHQLKGLKYEIVKRIILAFDNSTKEKDTGHIHQDNPHAPICSAFLLGKCRKGLKCQGHHCHLPFHWQYSNRNYDWRSLTDEDNDKLEKLYCDVKLEQCEDTFQISLEREGSFLLDESHDASILLDNKMLLVKSDFEAIATLRRLSTVSYVSDPNNAMATQWMWYWKDECDTWREYDTDHTGKDLQQSLEEAFLNKRDGFRFRIADQDYTMSFIPESDMNQRNVKYGTTRKVRRRPAKFVSRDDMRLLRNRSHVMFSTKQQGRRMATNSNLPLHWSSMTSKTEYKRVSLASSSDEFKEVEKLFKKSMKRSVKIVSIERVQNPFMWEKYTRKKENMLASTRKALLNERRLFHGTSPEIVEAICKQNFDWRLHGKNATKYGQGSYFAVNSSYSDAYAKEDDSSSKFMFVAKVLVGSYTTGDSSYRRPPQKDPSNPASDLYDSCVDDRWSPSIFVVFDTDQFYPEYIIQYSAHTTSAAGVYQKPVNRAPVQQGRFAPAPPPQWQYSQVVHSSGRTASNYAPASASGFGASAQSNVFTTPSVGASPYSSTSSYSSNALRQYSSPSTASSSSQRSSYPSNPSPTHGAERNNSPKCLVM